jgi:hypothetical protein
MFVLDDECRLIEGIVIIQGIVIIAIRGRQRFLQQPLDEPAAPARRNAALEPFDKLVRKTDQQLARGHCGSTLRIDIDEYIIAVAGQLKFALRRGHLAAGLFAGPFEAVPKIQIITLAELFDGKRPRIDAAATFRTAAREATGAQGRLL